MPIIGYRVYRIRSAATAELVPENIDVCDFSLTEKDVNAMDDTLDADLRGGPNPDHFGSDKIK